MHWQISLLPHSQAAEAAARGDPPPGPMDQDTANDVVAYELKMHGGVLPPKEFPGPDSFGARCEHAAAKGELPPALDDTK